MTTKHMTDKAFNDIAESMPAGNRGFASGGCGKNLKRMEIN